MSSKAISDSASLRDPSTYLQRPTSAKSPDVSHILTSIFGEIFTKDVLSADLIKNLTVSSDVDDDYHKRYVQRLKEAQLVKENRVQEYAMLEKHLLEARAKALAYEEREDLKRKNTCDDPDSFGVPPIKSYFSHCLDDSMLKECGLLVPSDYYYRARPPYVPMPKSQKPESFLRDTIASRVKSKRPEIAPIKTGRTDFDDIEELHKAGSDYSDEVKSARDENSSDDERSERKPFWKDSLGQENREMAKEELRKLENRTKFLTNPRLEAARNAQLSQEVDKVFEVNPKLILFDKYSIGKVYEREFEVRNVSTIAHQMRVLPPNTQFFSLSLGQYPKSQSVIAPGLSAHFNIRFAPDSLCSFEDDVLIECSNGSKIKVPLVAKRDSPKLTIGGEIDCGKALVGQIKVCRYLIQNEGGDGRFVILSKSSWPVSTFKTNVSSTSLSLYPFEIQPCIFELRKGDVFAIEIVFRPPDLKRYEHDIVITCDNCTSKELRIVGEGELALIEFLQQEEDLSADNTLMIDEYKDLASTKILKFPTLNPNVYTRKRFAIRNKSTSPIDFTWAVFKSVLEDNLFMEETQKSFNRTMDQDTCFSIAPKQGTLDRNDVKVFEVMFSPSKVGSFNNLAQFLMHGIPEINKQMLLNDRDEIHKASLNKEDMSTSDFVGVGIELRGECEAFQFTLDPAAIYVPGEIYMNSTTRKAFRLINMSICSINFNWKQNLEPHVIQVEPSYGEIAPKSYALMDVLITGTKPGKIVDDVACFIEFADEPIYLHVEADVKGPEVVVREAGIDFGLVQVGESSKSYITVENISNLPLEWSLTCAEHQELFEFPPEGSLLPLEIIRIEMVFAPKEEIMLKTFFDLEVKQGNRITCNCFAQAQRPSVSFLQSQIHVENLYLNVEHALIAQLCNHSVIEAEFSWGKPEGEDCKNCSISIEPTSGVLKPKSMLDCRVNITPFKLGEISDVRIPCFVQDMLEPIFVSVEANVKGVSVNYYLSDSTNLSDFDLKMQLINGSKIDFGECKVGENPTKFFVIQNSSAIPTKVSLEIKNFKTVENSSGKEKMFYDPMKKPSKISDKYSLKEASLGLGFVLEKPTLSLAPFGMVKFGVIALAEMWGVYEDFLLINVEGVEHEDCIGFDLNVTHSPVKIFAGKVTENETEEISMLRFGTQTYGAGAIKRNLKLQNLSSIPVQIEWKIFLIKESDNKLIDVNLLFDDINEADLIKMGGTMVPNNAVTNQSGRALRSRGSVASQLHASIESKLDQNTLRGSNTTLDYYDSGYIYVDQLPLIKLSLTSHYGVECDPNAPEFFLNTNKTFLKPKEKITTEVMFNTDIKTFGAFEAIFVGYLSVPLEFTKGEGFERKVGFEKEPIRFKATSILESPNLVIETSDETSLDLAIGDLIQNQNTVLKEKVFKNHFSLLNSSQAPVEFKLKINEPFYFSDSIDPNKKFTLKQNSKLKVDILFKFDRDYIEHLDFSKSNEIILQDNVAIIFSKDLTQLVPVCAKIFGPEMRVNKESLHFGTCLVGQERCIEFVMKNPSSSSLIWSIAIENDPHSVFECDTYRGFLEANKFFIKSKEQMIKVFFKAKYNEEYKAKLIISIEPSNGTRPPICIDLSGEGSYDQTLEAVLNV